LRNIVVSFESKLIFVKQIQLDIQSYFSKMAERVTSDRTRLQSEGASKEGGSAGNLDLQLPALAFRNIKDARLLALDIGGSLAKIAYYSPVPLKRLVSGGKGGNSGSKVEGEVYEEYEGARLHFIKFETRQIEKCLDYIYKTAMQGVQSSQLCQQVYVTGGGAYKYSELIESKLGLTVVRVDEMATICSGANFLLTNIVEESFLYDKTHYVFQPVKSKAELFPYLLVTIGSGVSIIKVDSETSWERIGGTATGGGTFWGLGRLLTGEQGFDNLLELAIQGDFRNCDMLVKDIYGSRDSEYTSLGLSSTLIASSFGKAISVDCSQPDKKPFSDADMARSLLYLVSNDIGHIVTLYAMLHKVKNIYFGGFFLRHHPVSLHTISYAVNFWSKGEVKANFLRHEGYLGAIGAFLKGCQSEVIRGLSADSYSWTENLFGSSSSFPSFGQREGSPAPQPSASSPSTTKRSTTSAEKESSASTAASEPFTSGSGIPGAAMREQSGQPHQPGGGPPLPGGGGVGMPQGSSESRSSSLTPSSSSMSLIEVTDHLEIDRYERLGSCPLLDDGYVADTVDLTRDDEARQYWLSCFEDSLPKFTDRAVQSQVGGSGSPTPSLVEEVNQRADKFKEVFLHRIKNLRWQPYAHGSLTVRNILDMREQCLSEYRFHDPYLNQKTLENEQAFELLSGVLEDLSKLSEHDLIEQLARGMLAGNVFDWGAKEVALLMESESGLKFEDALKFVRPRPWLVDDLDEWRSRLTGGDEVKKVPHKCAAIFIDNSGVDVVLGVIPFVQFLLGRGTEVILCANNRPVLNDVTYAELVTLVQRASKYSPVIEEALSEGKLTCANSGQSSACLDLSRLSKGLVDLMTDKQVDLIVLEGMGRALHTNLYAKFKCESLKVAVVKNRWLATRLGGDMFSVIFKYETGNHIQQP